MKALILIACLLGISSTFSFAQWSDTTNRWNSFDTVFKTPAVGPLGGDYVLRSEDGGYFVIWPDSRNAGTQRTDIYATKFDKNGYRLWSVSGVPVAASELDEVYYGDGNPISSGVADGAGGFFFCWSFHTLSPYEGYGVAVQHIHADGSAEFGVGGYPIEPIVNTPVRYSYGMPQMIADGSNGFYLGFTRQAIGQSATDLFCYRYTEESGVLVNHGGGQLDQYAVESETTSACGPQYGVNPADAYVIQYLIYPDKQGGCNTLITVMESNGTRYVGYNRLCRVKKDCQTAVVRRSFNNGGAVVETSYKKDTVLRLYTLTTYSYTDSCHFTNTRIENDGYGFLRLEKDTSVGALPQPPVIVPTGGNINAEIIPLAEYPDVYSSSTLYQIKTFYLADEIYDSIPYQLSSDTDHPDEAFRPVPSPNAEPLDTLSGPVQPLMTGYNAGGCVTAASGNKVWMSGVGSTNNDEGFLFLQEMKLVSAGTKKYAFVINTNAPSGLKIGKDLSSSIPGNANAGMPITFSVPIIATNDKGDALFSVFDGHATKVSPIGEGGVLNWGSLGVEIPAYYANGLLNDDGYALFIFGPDITRVSYVDVPGYIPPMNPERLINFPSNTAWAGYNGGTTNLWTNISQETFDIINPSTAKPAPETPVVSVLDDYPVGEIYVLTYEHSGKIRSTNGVPYLDRNYTIAVGNNPHGSANISLRLYFTTSQFDSLKAADPTILTPGDLGLTKQENDPNFALSLPSSYVPASGDQQVPITGWGVVDGGYYIEFKVSDFSNFFVTKGSIPLPLLWIDVTGSYLAPKQASIVWTVTEEQHVKNYTVQYSADGVHFSDGCSTGSTNSGVQTSYNCTVALPSAGAWYFRVSEQDLDGRISYSKTILLRPDGAPMLFTLSPNPAAASAVLGIPAGTVVKRLALLSADGKIVWQLTGAMTNAVTIPLGSLPAGVYHLQVTSDAGSKVINLLKG